MPIGVESPSKEDDAKKRKDGGNGDSGNDEVNGIAKVAFDPHGRRDAGDSAQVNPGRDRGRHSQQE